jgi:hypothetical protein
MRTLILLLLVIHCIDVYPQTETIIGAGWAGNTVNTVVFRRNSVVSDEQYQYAAWYDTTRHVVLAKRAPGSHTWEVKQTPYTGNIYDAHNNISIMVDGEGYLHMAWDHHGHQLNYCRSVAPGSLELTEKMAMTSLNETSVTYPEFYRLPNGDLLFLYRDGASGKGNLVLNRYYTKEKQWVQVHNNLIDGEGQRNAYWQACVDAQGNFHISWVWRESPDVATNHDLCYATSSDGGQTWTWSDGKVQPIPINAANAQYIVRIPQNSDLINSTSMTTDDKGRPLIATYWRPANSNVPQYHLVYYSGKTWKVQQVSQRTTPFSLSGGGTRRIPISRPQVVADGRKAYLVFRDAERDHRFAVACARNFTKNKWTITDLTRQSVGQSEPSYDTEYWRRKKQLHLFVQYSGQGQGERTEQVPAQPVRILEWNPGRMRAQ